MYRLSPLTYLIGGIASTGLHGNLITCAPNELAVMSPPANSNQTCGSYLSRYAAAAGGQIYNPDATADCQYCSVSVADQFLGSVGVNWDERWRNFGIGWAYIVFNICVAVLLYYLIRVRKGSGRTMKERFQGLGFRRKGVDKAAS